MNVYKSRHFDDSQFRQDVMDAVNILMHRGQLKPDTHYDLRESRGKPQVWIWLLSDTGEVIPQSVAAFDAVDIITAADTKLVIGGRRFDPQGFQY